MIVGDRIWSLKRTIRRKKQPPPGKTQGIRAPPHTNNGSHCLSCPILSRRPSCRFSAHIIYLSSTLFHLSFPAFAALFLNKANKSITKMVDKNYLLFKSEKRFLWKQVKSIFKNIVFVHNYYLDLR